MKKHILLLFALFLLCKNVQAQNIHTDLLISEGGPKGDVGKSISVDKFGNIYVTGSFNDTIKFGSITLVSHGKSDIFIVKYESTGNVLWAKRAGGKQNDEALSISLSDTNIYITGYFLDTANFNSPYIQNNNNEIISAGSSDIFIAKYNYNGDFKWAKRAGGTSQEQANDISVLGDDIYIVGEFHHIINFNNPSNFVNNELISAGDFDSFIAKYNSNGDFIWAKRAGGTNTDMGKSIAVHNTDIYIVGFFFDEANFNTPSSTGINKITGAGGYDIFLAKYNNNGDFQWAKRAGGTDTDWGVSVAVSGSEVYITGIFSATINFNNPSVFGSNQISSAGNYYSDLFLAKYNSNGDFQWAKRAGSFAGDESSCDIIVSNKDIYITGYFGSPANFNTPSFVGLNELVGAGSLDIFIAKYNNSGDFLWAKRAGGIGYDIAYGIDVFKNDIYITGFFSNNANFNNPSLTGINEISSKGLDDIFIAKFVQPHIYSFIFNDINQNCVRDNESLLKERKLTIQPGNIILQTNENGYWYIDSLPTGTYSIIADTSGKWRRTCPVNQTFTITNPDSYYLAPSFGFVSTEPCAEPDVSIIKPQEHSIMLM
jgi:hypothetical protein